MGPGAPSDAGSVDDSHDHRDLSRGAGFGVAGSVLGRGLSFLTQVLAGRGLGPAGFGAFGLGWTLFRLGALLAPLGLHLGVLRFGSASPGEGGTAPRGLLRRALGLALLGGLASAALLAGAARWLERSVFRIEGLGGVLLAFAAALPLVALLTVLAAGARAVRRIGLAVALEQILQPAGFLVLGVAALALGRSASGVAWAHCASYVVATAAALAALRSLLGPGVEGPGRAALVRYSWPTALAGVLTLAVTWTDRLFVGYLMPGEAVGIYHAASQLPMALATVLGGFNAIFGPMAADLHARGEQERLRTLYRTATRWGIVAVLPVLAIVLATPRELLDVVFGSEYAVGARALFWLGVGQAVNVGTGGVGILLMMTGRERVWLRWT
ncbi:MAG: lipopolysaccharide biosynthesis protein, partial [Thermoanaerobaculia bacterium]